MGDEIRVRLMVTHFRLLEHSSACSIAASLSTCLALKNRELHEFSVQHIMDGFFYDDKYIPQAVPQNHHAAVFEFIKSNGLHFEKHYPSKGCYRDNYSNKPKQNNLTQFPKLELVAYERVLNLHPLGSEDYDRYIKGVLQRGQPLVGMFEVAPESLQNKLGSDEIYKGLTQEEEEIRAKGFIPRDFYSVLVVGYGTTVDGERYFRYQNSHGKINGKEFGSVRRDLVLDICHPVDISLEKNGMEIRGKDVPEYSFEEVKKASLNHINATHKGETLVQKKNTEV